jgi:hypothetical protein
MKKLRPEDIEFVPMPNNLSPEERAEAYARVKAAFTAEDLQRFIDGAEGIPMEEVLKELEDIQRQSEQGS